MRQILKQLHWTCSAVPALGCVLSAVAFSCVTALAGDWPQFLGPMRNGIAAEVDPVKPWTSEGPTRLWVYPTGIGFSAPSVVGDRVVVFHWRKGNDVLSCLEANTGKELWKYYYPCPFESSAGNGPRATPVMDAHHVYTLGALGHLSCVDLESGKKVWWRGLRQAYKRKPIPGDDFGIATSPLLEGDLLLVNVGGKQAGVVAFNKETGAEVWKATNQGDSYASPVAATINGVRYAVFLTYDGILFLDPRTGREYFSLDWRPRGRFSVNAASPVVVNDLAFFSAFDLGAIVAQVGKEGLKEIWKGRAAITSHYSTCVAHQGFLYGYDGYENRDSHLRCVELRTGKVRWTADKGEYGSSILIGNQLVILTVNGDLLLVKASPESYQELARASVLTGTPCRAGLAYSNGRLYARDSKNLVCWKLKP
jgi:outer membrane protein assembly factor BamB